MSGINTLEESFRRRYGSSNGHPPITRSLSAGSSSTLSANTSSDNPNHNGSTS
jgi:hypothetical protein